MKMRSGLIILLALLFVPSLALAHDFTQTDSLFFNANDSLYRQKSDNRPWQLVALPDAYSISQSLEFNHHLWLVIDNGAEQKLYFQDKLLRFVAFSDVPPAPEITLTKTDSYLEVISKSGNNVSLNLIDQAGKSTAIEPSLLNSTDEKSRFVEVADQLLFLKQTDLTVSVFHLSQNPTKIAQFGCGESVVMRQPLLALSCADGSLIHPTNPTSWQTFDIPKLRSTYHSTDLIFGWDKIDDHIVHIWHAGQLTNISLPNTSSAQVQQTIVSASRIMIQTNSGWSELLWQNDAPVLLQLPPSNSGTVIDPSGEGNLLLNGDSPLLSETAGVWQAIVTQGSFNSGRKSSLGWLIWQTSGNSGSLTQFAPAPTSVFAKVNPWSSTTSPIQAVSISEAVSYVSVITQSGSGNTNLYKTSDFVHWSRITLPTQPTYSPSIAETRYLAAGSLVEIDGVITVKPGVVSDDVIYLGDSTAGVQLFLSKTAGTLPQVVNKTAVATGEISSSQTKRVILSSLADLSIGESSQLDRPQITTDQVENNLGRLVFLKGTVDSLGADYVSLVKATESLKTHFIDPKKVFQDGDQLIIPAVIDWNSSSGKTESWATSGDYQLLSRLTSPEESTSTTTTKVATKSATKSSATTAKLSTSVIPIPLPMATDSNQPPVLVAGASNTDTNNNQTVSMNIISLLAGLLAMQGRRFRHFLRVLN